MPARFPNFRPWQNGLVPGARGPGSPHGLRMATHTCFSCACWSEFSWTWHPVEARTTRPGYPAKESEIDGHLRLPPTYSPETGVYDDCNFDLSLLKWGCHTLLKANERLKLDDPLAPRWRDHRPPSRLPR